MYMLFFENTKNGRITKTENRKAILDFFVNALREKKDFPEAIEYSLEENEKEVWYTFTKKDFTRQFVFEK